MSPACTGPIPPGCTSTRTATPHRWYVNGQPVTHYDPSARYETPSLVWVKDGEEYFEDDDEPHDVGHLECRGAYVERGYTADAHRQFIRGLPDA